MIILFFIGFFVITNWKIAERRNELQNKASILQEEVQELERKSIELKSKKEEAESSDYIEKVAREKLELKKPGEEVVVVQKGEVVEEEKKEEEETWWDKIKSIWMRD